jgi:hypothetical protein
MNTKTTLRHWHLPRSNRKRKITFLFVWAQKTPEFDRKIKYSAEKQFTIGYVLEVDSPYNPESVFSNFNAMERASC